MILSEQLIFSDGQNPTGTGATASTNIIDLKAAGTVLGAPKAMERDIGKGRLIPLVVEVTAVSGTNPTLDVDIEVDDNSGFTSAKVVASAVQFTGGSPGRVRMYAVCEGADEQYMRLNYTLGGTSPDYTINAYIPAADQTNDKGEST